MTEQLNNNPILVNVLNLLISLKINNNMEIKIHVSIFMNSVYLFH